MQAKTPTTITAADLKVIALAADFFEDPGLFSRLLGLSGNFIEDGVKKLPPKIQIAVQKTSTQAIQKCLWAAVKTVDRMDSPSPTLQDAALNSQRQCRRHSVATGVTGALSGFFGPATLVIEIPFSTSLMMRSIALTAQEYGFDLRDPEVLMDCLFVFSLGGPNKADDGMDTSYLASRLAFRSVVKTALESIGAVPVKSLLGMIENQSTPVLARLVSRVADRFGLRVGEKILAQMAPIVGALGGASINVAFANYFGTAARHHFALKNLGNKYGAESVNRAYQDHSLIKNIKGRTSSSGVHSQ